MRPWRVRFSSQDDSRYDYWRRKEFSEEQWEGLRDLKPLLVGFLRFFPAGGASNPTLAVVTLSVRLPDHLIVCDTGRPVLAPIPSRLLGSECRAGSQPSAPNSATSEVQYCEAL